MAFGIELYSRYGWACELCEMLNFAEKLAKENVHHLVESVFYDSKAQVCSFKFAPSVTKGGDVAEIIEAAAEATIRQFEFFGVIGHGEPMEDFDE